MFNTKKANNSKKNKNDIITEYFNEITTKKALELNYDGTNSPDNSPKKAGGSSSAAGGASSKAGTSEPAESDAKKKIEVE